MSAASSSSSEKDTKAAQQPKPELGVDWETKMTPFAFCMGKQWDLKSEHCTKPTVDTVLLAMKKYQNETRDVNITSQYLIHEASYACSKTILEAALKDFKWDTESKDPLSPPGLLVSVAIDVRDFILEGGAPAMRRVQTRLSSDSTTSPHTSPN